MSFTYCMFFPISLNPTNSLYTANTSYSSVKNGNIFLISCTLIYGIFSTRSIFSLYVEKNFNFFYLWVL